MFAFISFLAFTLMVAVIAWLKTRKDDQSVGSNYFLAGRSLPWFVVAGSLMLTNLSTEQLVGLNGGAFKDGLAVMAWEVIAGASLVVLALFFLPRYLKSGIATVPQFLEERYGPNIRALTTFLFIVAYMLILLPFVLFRLENFSILIVLLLLPEKTETRRLGLMSTRAISCPKIPSFLLPIHCEHE